MNLSKYFCSLEIYSAGTTKVTSHIPGYNGFIPKTDLNPTAQIQGKGEGMRTTFIKNNIVENYQIRIPGY